ncbi:MAG: hypothetical protein NZ908_00990 [Candidatus Micrarchaeota archaeon]|nr:hypothetical protein [Candidatus Micrarchaeota archaeon]MCX8154298.1 hypothetical protein [Candidatus Micrarchaeota archaeon]
MKLAVLILLFVSGCVEQEIQVEPTERIEEPRALLEITRLNNEYEIEYIGSFFVQNSGYYITLKSISRKRSIKYENEVFKMADGELLETVIIVRKSEKPNYQIDLTKYTFYLAVCDGNKCYDSFIKSKKYHDRTEFTYITPLPPKTNITRIYTGILFYTGGWLSSDSSRSALIAEIDPRLVG